MTFRSSLKRETWPVLAVYFHIPLLVNDNFVKKYRCISLTLDKFLSKYSLIFLELTVILLETKMAEHVQRISFQNRTWGTPFRNGNRSFNTTPIYIEEPPQGKYVGFLSFCLAVISVLGVLINALMIYLTKTSKKRLDGQEKNSEHLQVQRKNLMYFFILNLAISDATGALVGAPALFIEVYLKFTAESDFNCKFTRFIQLLFPIATVHLLLTIMIERWRTIASPLFVLKKATAKIIISICWLWSATVIIFLGLPSYKIQISNIDKQHFTLVCLYNRKDEDMARTVLYIVFCFVAFVTPCVSLVSISIYIASRIFKDRHVGVTPLAIIVSQREKYKVTRIFLCVTAAFVMPYLAYIFYGIVSSTGLWPKANYQKDLALRCTWATLIYGNTIVNPILIFIQCKSLRRQFCTLFTRAKQNKVSIQIGDAQTQAKHESTEAASGLELAIQELNTQKPSTAFQ